jgi:hypothetical protein
MKWSIRGESFACCSCTMGCPCAVGEMETTGSDGCSAVQIIDIHAGEINGINVGGVKLAAVVDWPGAMMAGNGTGRLYFNSEVSAAQRDALEALIGGRLGGAFSRIPELVPKVLTSILAPICRITDDHGTAIKVGEFGQAVVKPIRSANGAAPRIHGTGGFRDDVMLGAGIGSWWHDPELRHWEGGGYAEQSDFDWHG